MSKGNWRHKGFKFGAREDANLGGADTLRIGTELIDVWPSYCVRRYTRCVQCHIEGKIQCAPRFREVR